MIATAEARDERGMARASRNFEKGAYAGQGGFNWVTGSGETLKVVGKKLKSLQTGCLPT